MNKHLASALLKILQALPLGNKHHLYDRDGSLYMGRWNIVGQFKTDKFGRDIMGTHTLASRALMYLTGGKWASIRLHRIMRGDHERHFHCHPFNFKAVILKGWYTEDRPDPFWFFTQDKGGVEAFCHRQGDVNTGLASDYHRITGVSLMGVWTMFFMGPNSNEWGFYVPEEGGYMKSSHYFLSQRRAKQGLIK